MTIHRWGFRYVTEKWNLLTLHCNSRLEFLFISDPQLVGQYQLLQGKTCNCPIQSIAVEHKQNPPLRHASATSHPPSWKLHCVLFITSINIMLYCPKYVHISSLLTFLHFGGLGVTWEGTEVGFWPYCVYAI